MITSILENAFAAELEYQLENDESLWADDARDAIESGEITAEELVECAIRSFLDDGIDFTRHFTNALEMLV